MTVPILLKHHDVPTISAVTRRALAARSLSRNVFMEAPNSVSKALAKVNSLGSNPQLMIALHSPNALLKTGLRMCPPEKSRDSTASNAEQSVFRSPVLSRNNREIRALFAYFGAKRAEFLCSSDCVAEREGYYAASPKPP